jgi:hypothetical protein
VEPAAGDRVHPTLKLKRNEVITRYGGLLEALHAKQGVQPAARRPAKLTAHGVGRNVAA